MYVQMTVKIQPCRGCGAAHRAYLRIKFPFDFLQQRLFGTRGTKGQSRAHTHQGTAKHAVRPGEQREFFMRANGTPLQNIQVNAQSGHAAAGRAMFSQSPRGLGRAVTSGHHRRNAVALGTTTIEKYGAVAGSASARGQVTSAAPDARST